MLREIPLSDFGLETVTQVCERMKWNPKSVQNWIRAGLIPAVSVGGGRGHGTFLLRTKDVDTFEIPKRGPRPKAQREAKPVADKKAAAPAKKPTERKPRARKGGA